MTNKTEIKLVMQSTREYANRKSKQIARRTNYSTMLNRKTKQSESNNRKEEHIQDVS
jgi:hypothetical protein